MLVIHTFLLSQHAPHTEHTNTNKHDNQGETHT